MIGCGAQTHASVSQILLENLLYFIQVYDKDKILLTVNRMCCWGEYYRKSMSACVHVNTRWDKHNTATNTVCCQFRVKKKVQLFYELTASNQTLVVQKVALSCLCNKRVDTGGGGDQGEVGGPLSDV